MGNGEAASGGDGRGKVGAVAREEATVGEDTGDTDGEAASSLGGCRWSAH